MKNSRLWFAVAVLLLTVGFGSISPLVSAEDEGAKCNCWYPGSGRYGIIMDGGCVVTDCWIPVGQ